MGETKLEQQVSEYAKLAKENPKIDMASLMMSALQQQNNDNIVSGSAKRWAYFMSIGLPPFGLLFALRYYVFSDKADAKRIANICVLLTAASVAVLWIIMKIIISSAGITPGQMQQIEQITPKDIQQSIQ